MAFCAAAFAHSPQGSLPSGFVSLSDVAPGIAQDMRYATRNNFLGRPLDGYAAGQCILRARAARALARVHAALAGQGYGLMVFDCTRPLRAVSQMVGYARSRIGPLAPYHPRVDGRGLLAQGYVSARSGHSTGLAVDLTLIHLDVQKGVARVPVCGGPWALHEADMGTGFDCFDPLAGDKAALTPDQARRRSILHDAMMAAGFVPYAAEWWHFSLPPRSDAERRAVDFTIR